MTGPPSSRGASDCDSRGAAHAASTLESATAADAPAEGYAGHVAFASTLGDGISIAVGARTRAVLGLLLREEVP
jgi:hypothetical protein